MQLKTLCVVLLSLTFLHTGAQVQTVVFAGPQLTSALYKVNDSRQPTSSKTGYMGGIALKVPFDNNLYFFPALYYSRKGYKVTLNNPSFPPSPQAKNNNTSLNVVEIAPLFQVDLSRSASHVFLRVGPSVDVVLSGTEQFDTSFSAPPVKRNMVFSFGDYGRITAALNAHLGFEVNRGLVVFVHYAQGVGNLNNADNGPQILHRIYGLSLGWQFGHNPNVFDTRVKR